jgi:hypothetical protein
MHDLLQAFFYFTSADEILHELRRHRTLKIYRFIEPLAIAHPSFKGDLGGDFATCEFIQTYTCKDTRRMCCLIPASEGGSLTRDASLSKADLTLSSFTLSWADLAAPFGSYKT